MIKKLNYFTTFEKWLWLVSVTTVLLSFIIFQSFEIFTCIATLLGVTSLIFLAKGHVAGQIIIVVFSLLYAYISFQTAYYGEMITYLGMTAPMAVLACVQWIKNPHEKGKSEVKIASVTKSQLAKCAVLTIFVTIAFYFILKYLGTANLAISTLSIATSFVAMYLTYLRSQWYAFAYGINDLVLISLWLLASVENIQNLTMAVCFILFFINDIYGFVNWKKMKEKQGGKR
ncbi:MAG: nicotinamide riboside transporter PnuC [Bacillota bacterium]